MASCNPTARHALAILFVLAVSISIGLGCESTGPANAPVQTASSEQEIPAGDIVNPPPAAGAPQPDATATENPATPSEPEPAGEPPAPDDDHPAPSVPAGAQPLPNWPLSDWRELLANPDDELDERRNLAVMMLGVRRVRDSIPVLNSIVGAAPSPRVRASAAWALGRMKDPSSIDPLAKALEDEHPEVQAAAIEALGAFETTDTFEILANLARKADGPVALEAVKYLATEDTPARRKFLAGIPAKGPEAFESNGQPLNHPRGAVIYVDASSGDDKNPGTADRPFATLAKAVSRIESAGGNTVMATAGAQNKAFRESVYLTPDKMGVPYLPTILSAWPGKPAPIVDGAPADAPDQPGDSACIDVRASYVRVEGFTVRHCYSGIDMKSSMGGVVSHCTVEDCNRHGIFFYYAPNGQIIEPKVARCGFQGISIRSSPRTAILGGTSTDNGVDGLLFLWDTDDAIVYNFESRRNKYGLGLTQGSNGIRVIASRFLENKDKDVIIKPDCDLQMIESEYKTSSSK